MATIIKILPLLIAFLMLSLPCKSSELTGTIDSREENTMERQFDDAEKVIREAETIKLDETLAQGRILSIDFEVQTCQISVGTSENVKVGDKFFVTRENIIIARLIVIDAQFDFSQTKILKLTPDEEIRVGDIVEIGGPPTWVQFKMAPSEIMLDGQSTLQITVFVFDSNDNPVQDGTVVNLSVDEGTLSDYGPVKDGLLQTPFTPPMITLRAGEHKNVKIEAFDHTGEFKLGSSTIRLIPPSGKQSEKKKPDKIRVSGLKTITMSSTGVSGNSNLSSESDGFVTKETLKMSIIGQPTDSFNINMDYDDTEVQKIKLAMNYEKGPHKVSFGDILLKLKSTEYTGYNRNLFGLQAETQIGRTKISLISTKTRGETGRKTFTGRIGSETKTITDSQYIQRRYYHLSPTFSNLSVIPESEKIELDDNNSANGTGFSLLTGGAGRDYELDYTTGIITFTSSVGLDDIIRVSYSTGASTVTNTIIKSSDNTTDQEIKGKYYYIGNRNIEPASEVIAVDGTTQNRDIDYTIDYDLGIVIFSNAFDQTDALLSSISMSYKYRADIYILDQTILEGSEVVRLNDQSLTRDVDYIIDYDTGIIDFINARSITEDSIIEIDYEYIPLGKQFEQSLYGVRGEYEFNDNFSIGTTYIANEDDRPSSSLPDFNRIPRKISILDFDFQLKAFQEKFTLNGEFAKNNREINTSGGVLVDDMEGEDVIADEIDTGSQGRWTPYSVADDLVLRRVAVTDDSAHVTHAGEFAGNTQSLSIEYTTNGGYILQTLDQQRDFNNFESFVIFIYGDSNNEQITLDLGTTTTDFFSYNPTSLFIDWTGWRRIEIPIRAYSSTTGAPDISKIQIVKITISRGVASPSILYIDDISLTSVGTQKSDAVKLSLNINTPRLKGNVNFDNVDKDFETIGSTRVEPDSQEYSSDLSYSLNDKLTARYRSNRKINDKSLTSQKLRYSYNVTAIDYAPTERWKLTLEREDRHREDYKAVHETSQSDQLTTYVGSYSSEAYSGTLRYRDTNQNNKVSSLIKDADDIYFNADINLIKHLTVSPEFIIIKEKENGVDSNRKSDSIVNFQYAVSKRLNAKYRTGKRTNKNFQSNTNRVQSESTFNIKYIPGFLNDKFQPTVSAGFDMRDTSTTTSTTNISNRVDTKFYGIGFKPTKAATVLYENRARRSATQSTLNTVKSNKYTTTIDLLRIISPLADIALSSTLRDEITHQKTFATGTSDNSTKVHTIDFRNEHSADFVSVYRWSRAKTQSESNKFETSMRFEYQVRSGFKVVCEARYDSLSYVDATRDSSKDKSYVLGANYSLSEDIKSTLSLRKTSHRSSLYSDRSYEFTKMKMDMTWKF